jgi:ankyrin repeat protein
MTTSLPPNPSFENLKKRAKTLKKAWQAGDLEALRRIRAAHPQYAHSSESSLRNAKARLTDCQLVLAREAGFASWPQLKIAVQSADLGLPDEFVVLACLCYNDPHFDHRSFHTRAHDLLRQHPWLASAHIWSAAAAGNVKALRVFLDEDSGLVNRPGPIGWVPLICACYSRVKPVDASHSTFDAARLLLDRGADANAYVMKGNADERLDQTPQRFSVLMGVFGGGDTGMANQTAHPRWGELADLLLERGASPADAGVLGMTQDLRLTSQKLEILLRHGLKPDHTTNHPKAGNITLMGLALARAVCHGDADSVRVLLAHHCRTDERFEGRTPWQHAIERGHFEIARQLEGAGAPTASLDDVEKFNAACLAGDEASTRAMLDATPNLIARAPKDMVAKAVGTGRKQAVSLVLDLGFDPNWQEDSAAIHQAGILAEHEDILRILIARGASVSLRDPWYDGTVIEWAEFFDFRNLRDLLLNEAPICLYDALDYNRLDRVPDVLARDPHALERPFAKCVSRDPKPEDWHTPLVRMVERGKNEAVRVLLERGADVSARHPDGRSLLQLARDKGFEEIAALLEPHGASM